jgi:two-component sensor histidine kinase
LSTVYGIEFDANGNIWCSTQRGLVKLNQSGNFLERYTATQGIQGDDFNFGASFTDSNGLMYFGGMRGYSRFDPLDMDLRAAPPKVAIADISYSNLTIRNLPPPPTPTTLELTHKDYFVKFNFSVLDFLDPAKNQYRYKLEGFDPDWVDNGTNNSATYTNLPPGEYVLRVQGANSAGVWNLEGASLPVRVLPPLWKTWWAYTFYTMIGLIIFWMSKRSYDSYAIEKRATQRLNQMHEDAERADDEMQEQLEIQDDLINSVYRHNTSTLQLVRDCISVQGNYANDPEYPESTQNNIRRIETLGVLESCVYYQSEQILADLHKFTDMVLETLLKSSSIGSESIVTINEVTQDLVPIDIASPLCILIGEILENCFTHAVDIDRKANYIHIKFSIQNKDSAEPSYSLSIQDNGLGIPDNIHCSYPETAGLGIAGAIAKKLGGVLDISVDKGTTVALNFPLPKSV